MAGLHRCRRWGAAVALAPLLLGTGVIGVRGTRPTESEIEEGALEASSSSAERGGFQCPTICAECCQALTFMGFPDRTQFKCVIPTESMKHFSPAAMRGRSCSPPKTRKSDKTQTKVDCSLTEAEMKRRVYLDLGQCIYDGPSVIPYKKFIGKSPCNPVVSKVVDDMYFSVDGIFLGVCVSKTKELEKSGVMRKICSGKGKNCPSMVKEDLCNMLQNDLAAKRIDLFGLATWGLSIGPMKTSTGFPLPQGPPRILKKFSVPGWRNRTVAYEAVEGDRQIDLQEGAFQCVISKLFKVPVEDYMTDSENNYVDLDHPVPGQKVFFPRGPQDVLRDYFDKFGFYVPRRHFPVDPAEMQTDATLVKLVFGSIGAHRVETVSSAGLLEPLSPVYREGTLAPASSEHLASLDAGARAAVRFAVRLEGLFEDVPVRPGMAKWGGNAFFSGAGDLVALQYEGATLLSPGFGGTSSPAWGALKFAFRSSLINTITIFDHMVSTHILIAETLAMATYETLPAAHGLRLLLTPHTWGTLAINFIGANTLFSANLLMHRSTPFTAEAFTPPDGSDGILVKKAEHLRYRPFREAYAAYRRFRDSLEAQGAKAPEIPFFEDGLLLHDAIGSYVQQSVRALLGDGEACAANLVEDWDAVRFVNRFFELNDGTTKDFWPSEFRAAVGSCEALISMLTECLFLVTGWHRHVGTVPDFFRDTSFAASAWKHGETRARPKQTMLAELLAVTTIADFPRLTTNITSTFKKSAELYGVAQQFAQSMVQLQATIEQRNQKRTADGNMEFHQMEPKDIEWGVEV